MTRHPAEHMQRLFLLLFLAVAVAACDNATDPGDPNNATPNTITVAPLADLPMIGGGVAGVAITESNTIIAIVDGKLYSMSASGGPLQLINGDPVHMAIALAPSGELYATTDTEIRSYDLPSGTYRSSPIDPAGPLAISRRVEVAEIIFSSSGQPYVRFINNTPQTYVYRTTDRGASWQAVTLPQGFQYGGGLAFAPNGDMLMSSTYGFYRSSDDGTTWTTNPPPRPGYGGALVAASNGDIYHYPPGGGGLLVSRDGGASFTELSTFNEAPFFTSIRQGPDGDLYATAGRLGFLRSSDGGRTWKTVMLARGSTFAMRGSTVVLGLELPPASSVTRHGGLLISQNKGTTWQSAGLQPVEGIGDIGFDKDGALMMLANDGLFRRTTSGWQVVARLWGSFARFSSTPDGTLLLASPTSVFHSTDNGISWKESLVLDYQMSPTGSVGIPGLVGRKNGEFLFSITNYSDAHGHSNGHLYRVGADGAPVRVRGVAESFASLSEDRNGILYGGTQTVDPLRHVSVGRGYTSADGGISWQQMQSAPSGTSFNSQNRYIASKGQEGFVIRKVGSTDETAIKLEGFTSQPHYITRWVFGKDDRLYLVTLDKGLFISNGPVR